MTGSTATASRMTAPARLRARHSLAGLNVPIVPTVPPAA